MSTRFGKFELIERLGAGGMAEVWRAKARGPEGFERTLVIKRILPHLSTNKKFTELFLREARLSAKLSHTNIVSVFELGENDGGYFLAMEYVRGVDLRTIMDAEHALAPAFAAYVMRDVCRALDYAHQFIDEDGSALPIVHRDVSPSNIMLTSDGAVKLLDFGIAKALGEKHADESNVKGKCAYLSPEQLESGREIDHRADLFSAGIILHELLTGRPLFAAANDLETLLRVRGAQADPPSGIRAEVTAELDHICRRALARNPDDRYQSAADMADDLDRVVRGFAWGSAQIAAAVKALHLTQRGVSKAGTAALPGGVHGRRPRRQQLLIAAIVLVGLAAGLSGWQLIHRAATTAAAPIAPITPTVPSAPPTTLIPTALPPSPTTTPTDAPREPKRSRPTSPKAPATHHTEKQKENLQRGDFIDPF